MIGPEDAIAAAIEAWAAKDGGVRVTRVRRSTGREDATPLDCANPTGAVGPHSAGRERWLVTMERLATFREEKVYLCVACAAVLASGGGPRR